MFGIIANLGDEFFRLGAGGSFRFATDDAMNALAVDHDVDGENPVAAGLAFKGNAVFADLPVWRELPHGGAGKLVEGLGHDTHPLERNVGIVEFRLLLGVDGKPRIHLTRYYLLLGTLHPLPASCRALAVGHHQVGPVAAQCRENLIL